MDVTRQIWSRSAQNWPYIKSKDRHGQCYNYILEIRSVERGNISTFGLKSDVTIVFLDPISCETREFRRIAYIVI